MIYVFTDYNNTYTDNGFSFNRFSKELKTGLNNMCETTIIKLILSKCHYDINYLRIIINLSKKYSDDLCADKIVLSDRYYLYDPKTIKKFNLEVDEKFVERACGCGAVKFLEWWKNSGLPLKYNENALNWASSKGHINVLEWWRKSNLPLKYNADALDFASYGGYINVLEWWLNSNLPLKYNEHALSSASCAGQIHVLNWWLNSNLPLKYDKYALYYASWEGHVAVLDWWLKSNLPLKYDDERALYDASYNGCVEVLDWWLKSNLPLKCDDFTLNMINKKGNMDIIKLFYNNNLMPWLDKLYWYIYFRWFYYN